MEIISRIRYGFLKETLKSQRGFILILALVSMVAMTVIGISLIMNMTTDLQLARNEREAKLAFQLADAGINEAIARFKLSLTPSPPYIGEPNPPAGTSNVRTTAGWAGQSFSGSDGLGYGVDVTYLTEGLPYCDSNNAAPNTSGNMIVDAITGIPASGDKNCGTEVVMFGRDFGLGATLTSIRIGKNPVYKIVSTGTSGTTTRQIEAYVASSSLNTDTDGGLNTNGCVSVSGSSTTVTGGVKQGLGCGCDAQLEAALGAGASDCTDTNQNELKADDDNLDTYLGGDSLSDIESMANEVHRCTTATCSGAGDDIPSSGMVDGVVQDWGDAAGNTRSTIIYINNTAPGNTVKISGNFSGRGILVITGNLILSGSLTYEGLVYVKGTVTVSGGGGALNVTGGIMAGGLASMNGNVSINYDLGTLMDVGRQNSGRSLIVWRRL